MNQPVNKTSSVSAAQPRDLTIEALRLLACVMVVATHVKPPMTIDGEPSLTRILITCLVGDGVSVFWCILGAFLLSGEKEYPLLLRRTAKRVVLPLVLWSVFLFLFGNVFFAGLSAGDSLSHAMEHLGTFLHSTFLKWDPAAPAGGHLWYLYVYILIVLLVPAWKGMRAYFFENECRERLFLLVLFGVLVMNDFTWNTLLGISHHGLNGVIGAVPLMFLGYSLYLHRDRYAGNWKAGVLGLCVYAADMLLLALAERYAFTLEPMYEQMQNRINGFGFIKMIALFLIFFGFFGAAATRETESAGQKVIAHLGKLTFAVYLVHYPLIAWMGRLGVFAALPFDLYTRIGGVGYTLTATAIVLAASVALAEAWVVVKRIAAKVREGFR